MLAEGGTEYGHCVSIARGPSSLGPWESCPHNPILTHRSTDLPIQATGHADLVEDSNGHWWMVCLGIRPKGFHPCHVLGRETFLAPVTWVDDWPVVNGQGRIGLEMEGHPGLPIQNPEKSSNQDDFTDPSLAPHWNFIGNPDETVFGLESGQLRLRCAAPDLDTMGGQAWVGRRQQHFNFRAGCLLDFEPSSPDEEAGLTVFQNIHHHYEIAVTMDNGARILLVRKRIGSLQSVTAELPAPPGPLHLFIEGTASRYRLGYLNAQGESLVLDEGECRYLSTEVGGKFTGVYLAMYATSHNTRSTNEASFAWFDYDPTPET
jgi:alpha-N-arabinofuranosidase